MRFYLRELSSRADVVRQLLLKKMGGPITLRLILFITRCMCRIYKAWQPAICIIHTARRAEAQSRLDFSYLRRMTVLISKQLVIVKSCPARKRSQSGPRWSVKNSRLVSARRSSFANITIRDSSRSCG